MYRSYVVDAMQPLISAHFNLTVEMPLKAIIRGYSYSVIPISWTNRTAGESKLKIKEMGSRYLFIVLYLWLERALSRGDYHRRTLTPPEGRITENIPEDIPEDRGTANA
jgi:dolichol-phosphate mannosyltransferase